MSGRVPPATADGRVVTIGASLAGLRAAEALRLEGFAGTITIVGDETEEPYDRPPLSKQVLTGMVDPDRTRSRSPQAVATLST